MNSTPDPGHTSPPHALHSAGSLLLVEDHRDIAEMVGGYLEGHGFAVDYATDGLGGLHLAGTNRYDAIIVDVMLPGIDGLKLSATLRRDGQSDVPILMLTARDTLGDKLSGFAAGADDYLVKPFEVEELLARVTALVRRHRGDVSQPRLQVADLVLDLRRMTVVRDGHLLAVTPTGIKLLRVLMHESPAVVSRERLEVAVWGEAPPDSDALRSHLYTLRKTVDRPFAFPLIHTVHGAGFRLADQRSRTPA